MDNSKDPQERHDVDQFIAKLIQKKAHQLARQVGFTTSDQCDIEQELRLKIATEISKFDPLKGNLYAFVTAIVERCAATIARNRRARKRNGGSVWSLSAVVGFDELGRPVELAATLDERANDARLGCLSRTDSEHFELTSDVANILDRLTDEERDVAVRLMHDSIAQVARDLGLAQSSLYDKMRRILRKFEDASLREYL